jgi:hypothetical protein
MIISIQHVLSFRKKRKSGDIPNPTFKKKKKKKTNYPNGLTLQ